MFGGYALYRRMLAMERLALLRPLFHLLPRHRLPKERQMKYADWLSSPLETRYRGTSADLTVSAKTRFYAPALARLARTRPYLDQSFGEYFQKAGNWPALSRLLYVDSKTWLVDDLLVKADKMTMAASVELRVPFLDHKVVEFAARLPDEFKLNGKSGKRILKKVAEKYLPGQIVHRTKQGFPLPVKRWMGGELYGDIRKLLLSDRVADLGLFHPPYLDRLLRQHQTGAGDHSRRIFSIMILIHWIKAFGIDPEMPRT